jgi:hypothetical protein
MSWFPHGIPAKISITLLVVRVYVAYTVLRSYNLSTCRKVIDSGRANSFDKVRSNPNVLRCFMDALRALLSHARPPTLSTRSPVVDP